MGELMRALSKYIAPLKRRVMLMVGRGIVKLVTDAGALQVIQQAALAGELMDDVERLQEYGFTSVPHPGAETVFLALAGERAHSVVIAVEDRRYRLTGLAGGEVAVYDDLGQKVHLKRNGILMDSPQNILIRTEGVLRLEADRIEIHGKTSVQTDVHGKGSRETWQSGTAWHTDSYTETHTSTSTEHGLDLPHIPSDHPEGL
jgi:phage baseplate assembly protein V